MLAPVGGRQPWMFALRKGGVAPHLRGRYDMHGDCNCDDGDCDQQHRADHLLHDGEQRFHGAPVRDKGPRQLRRADPFLVGQKL